MADIDVWTVYIIQAESGKLYTGITKDLTRRFEEHRSGRKGRGARFFGTSLPEKVVYQEICANRSEASKRESAIKRLTREQKLALVASSSDSGDSSITSCK